MYRQLCLLFFAALLALAHAQHPRITPPPGPRSTVPPGPQSTAAPRRIAKRQDNVKKTIELHELHSSYGAPIGVDSNYLTMDGSSTKWVGVDTEFLVEMTRTTTVDSVETTTVVKPQLAVVTASEASEGVGVGDVTVLMSDKVQDELDALIKDAAASCGGAKPKRDIGSCMINALQGAAENDDTLRLINAGEWAGFDLRPAANAPEILANAIQVLKTQAQRNKFAVMVAAAVTAGAFTASEPVAEAAHKFVFSDGMFGYPDEDKDGADDGKNDDDASPTEKTTASSSDSSCDPSATADENSPACDDEDCKGKERVCQAEGEKHNCPCVNWTQKIVEGHFDRDWANEQQKILKELEAAVPDVVPPQCFRNSHGDGFDGKPKAEPSAYCHCSSKKPDGGMTKGEFPTMSGEGDKACTYTTMPTETISIAHRPKETEITSCRVQTGHGSNVYCTCNDDKQHGETVTKINGKETTICPDATATMDSTPAAGEPSCYPTHGENPDKDELIKLCRATRGEFADVCRQDVNKEQVFVGCPGRGPQPWDRQIPLGNNFFDAMFLKAKDAPDHCDYLFNQRGSGDEEEVRTQVDNLCIPAYQAIRDKCTWNGGEVKNECGTFMYQSCPFGGKRCKFGSPGG